MNVLRSVTCLYVDALTIDTISLKSFKFKMFKTAAAFLVLLAVCYAQPPPEPTKPKISETFMALNVLLYCNIASNLCSALCNVQPLTQVTVHRHNRRHGDHMGHGEQNDVFCL